MKKICMLRKYLIVSYICFFILMPLSFTNSTKKSTENIATNSNENLIKIVSFKADSASIMYYPFGHLGSIWWSPLQFNVHRGAMELEVNGELQTVDLPVWIGLRYYLGIGPSLKDMAQGLGVKLFGICGDVAVMPFSLLFPYIYSQPLFYVSDIVDFGQTAWGLATADFNNDTHMDFVVSSADAPFTHSTISIFYNNGDGSFTREDVYRFAYSYITDLNAGDYNNDGQIDLLFTYSEYTLYGGWLVNVNGSGILLFNDGNNVFGNPTLVFHHGPGIPYDDENRINPQVVSADFNNDGTLDFVVGDNSGKVEFYTNEGTGIFTSAGIINDWGNCSWGFTVGDFDSDFDFDFMVSAQYGITDGRIYLINNQMMESNGSICFASESGEALLNYSSIGSPCLQTLDFNDDGQFDLIVGIDDHVFLCINTQNSFEIIDLGQLPENEEGYGDDLGMGSLSVGDYNNDRKDDVLIGGFKELYDYV